MQGKLNLAAQTSLVVVWTWHYGSIRAVYNVRISPLLLLWFVIESTCSLWSRVGVCLCLCIWSCWETRPALTPELLQWPDIFIRKQVSALTLLLRVTHLTSEDDLAQTLWALIMWFRPHRLLAPFSPVGRLLWYVVLIPYFPLENKRFFVFLLIVVDEMIMWPLFLFIHSQKTPKAAFSCWLQQWHLFLPHANIFSDWETAGGILHRERIVWPRWLKVNENFYLPVVCRQGLIQNESTLWIQTWLWLWMK